MENDLKSLEVGDKIDVSLWWRGVGGLGPHATVIRTTNRGFCFHVDGYDYQLDRYPDNWHNFDYDYAIERGVKRVNVFKKYAPEQSGDTDEDI